MATSKVQVLFVVSLAVLIVMHVSFADEVENNETVDTHAGVKLYKMDRECAMVGGMCVLDEHCDPDYKTSVSGLCPSNKQNGVECCYKVIPQGNITCDYYLGVCMDWCHQRLSHLNVSDCNGKTCCTIV